MTVTREQAQMLTSLAIACRPHRAPTWDEAGVMAMLERVRHVDLGEVIAATIRLAKDPMAQTPAQIANPAAECWREQLKPPKWTPDQTPREERCGICGKARRDCVSKRTPHDDHAFEPDVRRDPGIDVHATVTALRAIKAEPRVVAEQPAPTDDPTEYHDHVQCLRAELAQTRTAEESA